MPCALAHLCLEMAEGASPRAKAALLWDLCKYPKIEVSSERFFKRSTLPFIQ